VVTAFPRGLIPGTSEWRRDRGYRRLLRVCRSALARVARFVLLTVFCTAGVIAGLALAGSLPASSGSVVVLAGILGAAAGAIAGWWLTGTAERMVRVAVLWCAASVALRAPAPAPPFFGRARGDGVRTKRIVAMMLAVPVLIFWGPVVGTLTLTHGFADQRLVSSLRLHGVPATGHVVDVPAYSRGYGDNSPGYFDGQSFTAVTYSVGLVFKTADGHTVLAPAPAIGGQLPLVLPAAVTVVYDPAQPRTAAVADQLRGSPWAGAPTRNLIAALLLTAALPVLAWRLIRAAPVRYSSSTGFSSAGFTETVLL
jgi:hypothetical protein